MIIDEAYILEHFGVKGMRWGKRKAQSSEGESSSGKDKAKKVAAISAGVAVAAGAGLALYSMKKSGNVKVSSLSSKPQALKLGSDQAKKIVQQRRSMASITQKLDATNKLADAQLKDWYNKFEVPFAERTFSG